MTEIVNVEKPDKKALLDGIKETFNLQGGDAATYSPLTLAYIGDSIYALVAKSVIVEKANCPAKDLHNQTVKYVSAVAQAKIVRFLTGAGILSEYEEGVLRRGRNAKSSSVAKNASVNDYRLATGLEALVGYLYLSEQDDRMLEILKAGFDELDRIGDD